MNFFKTKPAGTPSEQPTPSEPSMNLFDDVKYSAEVEYAELLSRASNPQPTDVDRLKELLPSLGITLQMARADYESIKQASIWEQELLALPTITAQLEDDAKAYVAFEKEFNRYVQENGQKLNSLKNNVDASEVRQRRLFEIRGRLNELKAKHPRAFSQQK